MKKSDMIGILTKASLFFDNFDPSEARVAAWFSLFKDRDAIEVARAFEAHCKKSPYQPKPCDIQKLIAAARGAIAINSGEAWGLVLAAISRFGSYREPQAINWLAQQDRLTAKVVRCLGYATLCASENQLADRAHFQKFYDQEAEKSRTIIALMTPERRRLEEQRDAEIFRLPCPEMSKSREISNLITNTAKLKRIA